MFPNGRQAGKAGKTLTVLLLDEVGLAEHSPEMPLKVLHTILVDPPVAIVGLSNWALDPAKMNRAICLQRPDPTEADMAATGGTIVATGATSAGGAGAGARSLPSLLAPLAQAFGEVYTQQGGRDFVGMRDFYSLLKLLRSDARAAEDARAAAVVRGPGAAEAQASGDEGLDPATLTGAICRSFGGKPAMLDRILRVFHARVRLSYAPALLFFV